MKIKKITFSLSLLITGILIGTIGSVLFGAFTFDDSLMIMRKAQLVELEELAFEVYRSSNTALAERALLRVATNQTEIIRAEQARDIPIDNTRYFSLMLTYGRLGVLLESQGNPNKAGEYYSLALKNWNSMDHGNIDRSLSIEKLKEVITMIDRTKNESQPVR